MTRGLACGQCIGQAIHDRVSFENPEGNSHRRTSWKGPRFSGLSDTYDEYDGHKLRQPGPEVGHSFSEKTTLIRREEREECKPRRANSFEFFGPTGSFGLRATFELHGRQAARY
jgi:hypothetical protein